MNVFITGGTGFIGSHLAMALANRGDHPIILTRSQSRVSASLTQVAEVIEGDPTEMGSWMSHVNGCDAVVHLAGEPINAKRWDTRFRQKLARSRIDSARYIVAAIGAASSPPRVLVSASGIDIYPFADELTQCRDLFEDSWIEEDGPKSDSFLARLCNDWEFEALAATAFETRVVCMRTGLVLGESGPLKAMARPFRAFVGGPIGSGHQWTSWIHIEDATAAYLHALDTRSLNGAVNLVAPNPLRNREFSQAIGKALHRPSFVSVPSFAIRLLLGDFAEYVLNGRRARSATLPASGFKFAFPLLSDALAALLGK